MTALTSDTLGLLLVCSVRYALGRRTYMPEEIARIVRARYMDVSEGDRETIRRDLLKACENPATLGDDCDIRTWNVLLDWIEAQ